MRLIQISWSCVLVQNLVIGRTHSLEGGEGSFMSQTRKEITLEFAIFRVVHDNLSVRSCSLLS